ncbi:MAG TPA: energy transducer TonB, partial [Blastocatellia bacterium]|nr:energy transducer TonB [Blastocatellia bacterium]
GEPAKLCKIPPEVLEKETVKRVKPVAPAGAPSSGVVSVRIWVDNDGKVVKAKVISGHPLLRKAALKAARQWKLKPTFVDDGHQIICVGVLNFDFS